MGDGDGRAEGRRRVREALAHARPALWAAGLFSLAFNILLLVSPLYMLQVYDRVLTSGSVETLLLLSLMAVALLGVFAAADTGRRRVFGIIGRDLGARLEREVFAAGLRGRGGRPLESAVADLGKVQGLFSSAIIQPLFDAPFVPMFAVAVFLVHPLLGALTIGGALLLAALAVVAERAAEPALAAAGQADRAASIYLAGVARQAPAIRTMGMAGAVEARWRALRQRGIDAQMEAARGANVYGGLSRAGRQILQTLTLGLAAWLVLRQEMSAGAIIASSILAGRCLAPIDQAIGGWRPLVGARQAWARLDRFVAEAPPAVAATPLPPPEPRLVLRDLAAGLPGAPRPLIAPFNYTVEPGRMLLVLGGSGAGKTTLLQVLSGAWSPLAGSVTLGGRDLHAWDEIDRGRHVGYLPQHVNLLPGTVRENIARFADAPPEPVFAAAAQAGCHAMILALPDGYDTPLDAQAGASAGQRQLIGLARVVYGDPAVLFLDEPSAHLDLGAVRTLLDLLAAWRAAGRIAVVASHDRRLLPACDSVLDLRDGRATLVERDAYVRALAAAAGPQVQTVRA